LEDEFFEFFELHVPLLNFNFEVDVLFECGVDLVGCKLGEAFFEKVDPKFDVEVFFLQIIDVLVRSLLLALQSLGKKAKYYLPSLDPVVLMLHLYSLQHWVVRLVSRLHLSSEFQHPLHTASYPPQAYPTNPHHHLPHPLHPPLAPYLSSTTQ
jgi:hypothetical protein